MQVTKTFRHPIHMVNYFNCLLRQSLQVYRPIQVQKMRPPVLLRELGYYFTMSTQARNELNQMLYAVCCFSADGEIIFSYHGSFDVSLWSFRRLGLARTADKIERTIRVCFKRHNVPLCASKPFERIEGNLYSLNIDWFMYHQLSR